MIWFQGPLISDTLQTNDFPDISASSSGLSDPSSTPGCSLRVAHQTIKHFCILASECSGPEHVLCALPSGSAHLRGPRPFILCSSLTMQRASLVGVRPLEFPRCLTIVGPSASPLLSEDTASNAVATCISLTWACKRASLGLQMWMQTPQEICRAGFIPHHCLPPEPWKIDLEFSCLKKEIDGLINSQRLFHMNKPQGFNLQTNLYHNHHYCLLHSDGCELYRHSPNMDLINHHNHQ